MLRKIKHEELKKGLLVMLDPKHWSEHVDTSKPGIVLGWKNRLVYVHMYNKVIDFWLYQLRVDDGN